MDSEPVSTHVHVLVADLEGRAAVHAAGADGEQYCIVDSTVIIDNAEARDAARSVFLNAVESARHPALLAA